jgi:hypothetical protein
MLPRPLIARVKNGRLVLDEPTDLPEGEELYLVPMDDDIDDLLDDEESQALHRELEASVAEEDAGMVTDIAVAMARLRAEP